MDTPTPPPIVQPPPSTDQRLRVDLVIRDAILISVLTFIGGMVVGMVCRPIDSPRGMLALAASNLLLGTIGFAISGSFVVVNRWRHLAFVALGVWFAGLLNLLFGIGIIQWFFGAFSVAFMMGLGGAFSFIFRKPRKQ